MSRQWEKQYITLVEFLGKALGPDYEIVLHSFTDEEYKIIALINEHLSGRSITSPLSALAMSFIHSREYQKNDFKCNYEGIACNGEKLRCSTMFIKDDDGELLGMLCINYNAEKYNQFAQTILDFIHTNYHTVASEDANNTIELFASSTQEIFEITVYKLFHSQSLPTHLSREERRNLIAELNARGFFHIKGATQDLSKFSGLSKATIYRYLNNLRTITDKPSKKR